MKTILIEILVVVTALTWAAFTISPLIGLGVLGYLIYCVVK